MPITAPSKKKFQYPYNANNAYDVKAWADLITAAGNLGTLAGNALSADVSGRAVMASNYFNDTTTTDAKFSVGALSGMRISYAESARSGAGAVPITAPTCLYTSTGSAQALTVADGSYTGQRLRIVHIADGGSGVITQTSGAKLTASITTITFTNVFDWVDLEWSGSLWNVIGYTGATIA